MVSKRLYGNYLRSYEQFLVFQQQGFFTIVTLTQKIYFDTKMASNPQLISDFCHWFVDFCPFGKFSSI